ncbi:hypothetical protein VIC_004151 [Vibrio coralliilyticus ATCC BAA-450]|nr:hypothetical protein VIC_004151 [Vibrio coralliilyticus ATCC BAA-450]
MIPFYQQHLNTCVVMLEPFSELKHVGFNAAKRQAIDD